MIFVVGVGHGELGHDLVSSGGVWRGKLECG